MRMEGRTKARELSQIVRLGFGIEFRGWFIFVNWWMDI